MSFDMNDIVIEKGSVQDAEELAVLEKVGFPGDEGASLETVRKRLRDFGDWFLVARYQGKIIGFVNGALSEKEVITDEMYLADYDPPQEANNLMIFSLVTDPAYRSQGLAARMLTALLEAARDKKVDKAALTCREYLIRYYESFGFTNLGISESVLGDKVWYDLVMDLSETCSYESEISGGITMNPVIQNMADRRSVRQYTDQPIPEDILRQIIEAGYLSPNAGNKQLLRMVVCEDPVINERLGRLRMLVTRKFWWPKEGETFTFSDAELDAAEVDNSFYGAPCVVYLFSPKDFEFAEGDCYIMSNDLCLAARSFDIGSCVISVATDYFLTDSARQILKDWGIPENYRIVAHAILGYPQGGFPEAKVHELYAPPLYVK